VLSATTFWASPAFGQTGPTPVYLDDSPSAEEAISRARALAADKIYDEASRVLQKVLDEHGDQVGASPEDPDLFVPLRTLVHAAFRANPGLLDRYIALQEPRASALMSLGEIDTVERTLLLTPSGLEAALRIAQRQLESAAFDSAALTLRRVRTHPNLNESTAPSALVIATQVARYLPDSSPNAPMVRELIAAWSAIAHSDAPNQTTRVEGPDALESISPYSTAEPPDLDGVVSKPMASERLGDSPDAVRRLAADNSNRSLPDAARVLNSMPVLAGDMVLTNDSESISAFDRFTLARRWRVTLVAPQAGNIGSRYVGLEDPNLVVVSDPYAIGLMGVSVLGRGARERILAAVDVRTGQLVWQTSLAEQTIPELRDGLMRGPVIVKDGVVVVSIVRTVQEHRLLSVGLAGFDLSTGHLRWYRTIGSIGYVQWVLNPEVIDAGVEHGGIVFRGDRIGLTAAVEAATGRIEWVRRMVRSFESQPGNADPWEGNAPVVADGNVFTLSPDRLHVVQLDAETGRLVSSTPSLDFASPMYLTRVGDLLAGVTQLQILAKPIARMGEPGLRGTVIGDFTDLGIRGRVVPAGEALVVPTLSGLSIVHAGLDADGKITSSRTDLALDSTGNAIIAQGQVVVADDDRVHSYLSWDAAAALLTKRMDASGDPSPAVTYAELAYRAARDDELVASIDRAIDRIEADPLAESVAPVRSRLFESTMEMIEPRAPRHIGGPLADATRSELVRRAMRIASTPEERVNALFAAGRMLEAQGVLPAAVEKYQEILASPALADAAYSGGTTRVPAEVEAVRRLRRLVGVEGRAVYAAYDAELDRLLVERSASTDAKVFSDLARRYPVATHAAAAWLEAARRWRAAGEAREAIRALEEGLAAAADALPPTDPVFGEIAGTLVVSLVDADRFMPASNTLDELEKSAPGVRLTNNGNALDFAALRSQIGIELMARSRRPRIGTEFGNVSILQNMTLAMISDRRGDSAPPGVVLLESADGSRSAWRADPHTGLEKVWETDLEGDVVRMDHDALYLSDLRSDKLADRVVTKVNLETGAEEWTSPPFSSLFSDPDPFANIAGGPPRVNTPLIRAAPLTDLFALFEPDTVVLVERTGRMAALDIATGTPLWSTELSRARVDTVFDAAVGDGLIVIGGTKLRPPGDAERSGRGLNDVVVVVDARTGEVMFETTESSAIRWVRIGMDGLVLVGFQDGVSCIDANRRSVVWRNDRPAVAETVEGWSIPNGVIVRDFDSSLYMLNARDGTVAEAPLPVAERLDASVGEVRLASVPGGNVVLGTDRGIALLSSEGKLLGMDAGGFDQRILLPVFTDGSVVTIGLDANPISETISSYRLNMYDTESARVMRPVVGLELGAGPRDMRIIDDRIIIAAGTVVAVIDAPAPATLPEGVPSMKLPIPDGIPPVPVPQQSPAQSPEDPE